MSAQNAKKKRIGSRRKPNQNKTSEADDFHITESASVTHDIPEENRESLNALANPDQLQSEIQNPPSPELTGNRKKLGASRRNRGGQHVRDSATESFHQPREEVDEETWSSETPKTTVTTTSLAIQPERQEELSVVSEQDIVSAIHSSLYSAIIPDYSSEVQKSASTNCPEPGLQSLIPVSDLQREQDDEETDYKVVSDSCKLVESMLGGTNASDTLQGEEVKQNAHLVAISQLTSSSLLSCPTVDQQLIDQSNSMEKAEEELLNVYSVTEKEGKERDEETELLRQYGNFQGSYLVSESNLTSVIQFSTTPEITTDKSSPGENTELEYSVEQDIFSSQKHELPKHEEQNQHFILSEVRGAYYSEDAVNKVHEQDCNPSQMHDIDHSSESATHDTTENSEIVSVNLIDQAELIVKSNDDSAAKQEDTNPDDKQEEHPTKENNFEASEKRNEDYHVYDTNKLQISDIEIGDTALGQVYEIEGQVEHDVKPSAEQTVYQEKKDLLPEMEESDSSLQTLQSEIHVPLDSQPQQDDTDFNPVGNRRKLGSSRKSKGRQKVKESVAESYHEHKEEVVELTRGNEDLDTTQMLVATERTSQEKLSQGSEHDVITSAEHDSSLYSAIMPGYSSEVQNPTATNYSETILESLTPKSENLQDYHDESETDFKVEESDKSVGATLEGMEKSDTLQIQDVRGAHHSEDDVNKVHEQELKLTHEIDQSSESATHDATENSEIVSVNLIDQAELIVKSNDDSVTKQEDSSPDDKQEEHPTKENNFEASEKRHEDYHVYDTEKLQISDIKIGDTALGQVYEIEGQVEHDVKPSAEQTVHQEKEGLLSEMEESDSSLQTLQSEIHVPLDSQPQQDDTDFNPIGSRRKLGSSRRSKGRQKVKESVAESYHEHKEEVVELTRGNEDLDTTQMLVATERTSQEKLSQGSEHDVITSAEHDSSLYSAIMPGYSSEVQNPTATNYSETILESLTPKSENLQDDHDESETDFKVEESDKSVGATLEGMEKSDTLQIQDVRGAHHSEDDVNKVHEQELKLTHEIDQSSESATHDATENSEIVSVNLIDQAELIVKSNDDSVTKQEDSSPDDKQEEHPTKENNFEASEKRHEDYHVYDTEKLQISDIKIGDTALGQVYEIEGQVEHDVKPSAEQTVYQEKEGLLPEMEESDSSLQTLQSEIHVPLDSQPQQDDTDFNPIGNRRKLGSSRKSKGRQKVKESVAESYHEHKEEVVELTRGNEDLDTTQMLVATERTSQEKLSQGSEHDVITSAEHDSSLYSAIMPGYSSEVQNPTATNYSETILESLTPKSENLQDYHDESETDFKVEESDKSVGATLEGMEKSDTLQIQDVRGAHHSEDDVNKVHEQELKLTHEIDQSSESATHDATENSEIVSVNLIDQAELIVKSNDDSVTKQEDSSPDDKQEEHPTKENNFEASEKRHEDYHVYDTEKLQISDIKIGDTALGQVYEIEGQVEHDVKPSAEQTVYQEKEGLLPEMEESDSSLQTLQSEIHVPLDSQPQQDDTDFNPIGNRRKLGSSRKSKGRQKVKESVAESYHEHKEEVVELTRGNEDLDTTQMLVATERTSQEKLSQGSEHDVITSAEHDSSLYSAIMPGYSSEVQNPTATNYSETILESLTPKSENLQDYHDESETDFKVEESDKSVGATLEGMEKSDTLQIQDVRGAHHSEDDVNKVHEQELKLTHEIDQSSESATHDATENSEIVSVNLIDQAELIVKSNDDSVTKQEDSSPDDKQEEHPTKENNFEASEKRHEDYHVYDTEKLQISDIKIGDTALGQVYEIEGQVEHDVKPSAEQTVYQEKEGLLPEMEESDSSLQTLQSEIHVPLDSQPQQDDTDFNPIGNRRKLGSSRKSKGRQKVKESVAESYHEHKEEVVELTRGNEDLDTTQMLVATERTSQEKLSQGSEHDVITSAEHDSSLYSAIMPGYSSEVQNPTATNYSETILESLTPKSENLQDYHDESETDFKVEESDKSVGATLEGMEKSDTLQIQDVRGAHHSEDDVNKVHEQELKLTHEIDQSSESATHDATENSEIVSVNLIDQAELIVKSNDDSVTKQEDSSPDDKQEEHPTKENNFEASEKRHEDYHVYDTEKLQISDIKIGDTALGQVYEIEGQVEHDVKPSAEQAVHQEKEGLLCEMEESDSSLQTLQSEIHVPLDSQPQQDDTDFNPIGNRRKLGSSRRSKGRQKVKESVAESYHEHKEEVVELTRGNEDLDTTQMLVATERTSQEKLSQGSEHDVITSAEHDSSLYSAIMPGYSSEVQNPTATNYSETILESLTPKSENLQDDHDESETDFKVEESDKSVGATLEGMEKSDTLQIQDVRGAHHSEDDVNKVHEQELKLTHEIDQSSESATHDATENSEIVSVNLIDQAELIVKSNDDSVTKQEDSSPDDKQEEHPTKENNFEASEKRHEDYHVYDTEKLQISDIKIGDTALGQVYEIEGQVEHDVKPSAEQAVHQEKEGLLCEMEESDSSLQTLQSEIHVPLDSQPQQDDTDFNPIGNRRKLGSSRRSKGRQKVKESVAESYHEHKEEVVELTRGNEDLDTTQMLVATERTSQEKLSQGSEHDVITSAEHDSSLYSAIMPGYSSEVQNPTATNYSETILESLTPKSENLQDDHDESETDFKVEESDKSVGATLEGMEKSDTLQIQDVRGAHHSEDDVNKVHEQELKLTHEIDQSSESATHDATENSEIVSVNLIDQAELIVKSNDDSVTKQEDSSPDDKQEEHPTKENNFEASEKRHEDYHVYDTEKLQISDIKIGDTALGQVYEIEGQVEHDVKPSAEQTVYQEKKDLLPEMEESDSSLQTLQSEIHVPLDSQPQQDDTDFNPIGNRRKLGSSRKSKGRQKVKESVAESYHEHKEEVVELTRGNEDLDTTQMLVATERTSQEKLSQGSEHDVITSAEHDSSLYSAIMPGYSSEVQNPTATNYSETILESLTPKSENLQDYHDESETDFKVEESDKSVGATLEGMEKSDTLQIQDVRGAHHSEDDVNKVHEQELKLTHEIDQSSESATHDATENSEIVSVNLIDQAELIVKSNDDSAAKQEDTNPDDKQEEHPTKENNFEASEKRNEDYHVYDTNKLQISDIEIGDTALGQVYKIEGQVEHDVKPSAEQTVHQEKEGLLPEMEESDSSLQTLQSEIHIPLDSQPQQDDTDFNPIGNRRKLGSSRRSKGRQKVKESVAESYHEHKEEVVELTRGNEDLDTTQMLVATERTSQEKLSQGSEHDVITSAEHDSSLYSAIMPGYSSEVQNPTATNYSETILESLTPKSENLQDDHDESETDFKVEESDKSVGATLEGMDKSDTLQIQDVRGAHHSEDDVNKVHEQELKITHEIDQSSESATHDATENSEIVSVNLIDQAELIVKSNGDSVTKQEDSHPDDKQEEHPTKENNFEASEKRHEDYHVYDTEKLQISDIKIGDTALGQVYEIEGQVEHDVKPSAEQTVYQEKKGLLPEMEESDSSLQTLQSEIHVPLDSQPQQDDTDFNPIGNRRKLGSSRRSKGRQKVKESVAESYHEHKEEVVELTRGNEDLDTTQMLVAIERTSQEKLSQGSEHDVITSAEHDSSLYSAIMPGYSSEVQNPTTTNYSETILESLIPKSENLQDDHDESETDFKVEESEKSVGATLEGMEKSDTLQIQDIRGAHHSEDDVNKVHEQELKLTHEIDQSSESATHDATENSEIVSVNLIDQAELIVKSNDDSVTKQEDSSRDDKQEICAPLGSHPQQDNTDLNPIGNRRKLGSSRRNRGRQHAKESVAESYHIPTEEVVGNTRDKEPLEISKLALTMETAVLETSSYLNSGSKGDQQLIDKSKSKCMEMPEEFPNVDSVTEKENKEKDKETELLRQDGNLHITKNTQNYLVSESHLKSDDIVNTEIEHSIEQAVISSSNEEQIEHVGVCHIRGALHSEDVVNEVHEETVTTTQIQEMHQIDFSSVKESEYSSQTLQSETNSPLDCNPLDNSVRMEEKIHTGLNPIGNRRKLGSSRRNKGRQQVKEFIAESYQEQKEEAIEGNVGDETLETTKMSLAALTTRHEELKEETDQDLKPAPKVRKIRSLINEENTEKMPEEATVLSQNVMDNSTIVTTDIISSSGKKDSVKSNESVYEEEKNLIKHPVNLSQFTGYDTVKTDLIQSPEDDSDIQNISYHDDNVTRSITLDILEQEDAYHVQKTEALSCDKDSLGQESNMQQTHVTIKDYKEAKSLIDVKLSGQEIGEELVQVQEMNASQEITHPELLSAAYNKNTVAPIDIGLEENVKADAGKSNQKRRKMGSTRRTQLHRTPEEGMDNKDETKESDFNIEAEMKILDKMEIVAEIPMIVTTEESQNENAKPSPSPVYKEQQETIEPGAVHNNLRSSTSDLQSIQSDVISDIDEFKAPIPGQSASHNEEVVNLVVQVSDINNTNSGITGESFVSLSETTQGTQNDEERPVNTVDLETVKSVVRGGGAEEHKNAQASIQEPNNVNEGAPNINLDMKNASPNLNSSSRRRKMGSTRKNLGSQSKREDLNQKQELDNEASETATNVGDVKTENFQEQELQLHIEDKDSDSEQRKEKVFETVEYSQTAESHFKPPSHQTFEENPVSHDQLVETEHQLTPNYPPIMPSTSPKHDIMSESASGGRRRKMGSHRKSHGHNENQTGRGDRLPDTQNGRDESVIKTTEEESFGLDKITEVDESDKKASSNITSMAGEHSRPVSEKTPERVNPVRHPNTGIRLSQESQKTVSLADTSRGADLRSNKYNVVMIGDSSVGKTSFMKRAQSGKFSLDLPASVGLDSCVWTVVVDGKPVVLQLWDTAGQERFHSLTRQILHKAQAFLLMYDITSSQSFSAVSYWATCIQEEAAENTTILLLGNKSDHAERRVQTKEAEILAKEYNFEFMECSAATGENVVQSLETVARMLSQNADTREETTVLHREPKQKKTSGCC